MVPSVPSIDAEEVVIFVVGIDTATAQALSPIVSFFHVHPARAPIADMFDMLDESMRVAQGSPGTEKVNGVVDRVT